MRKGNLLLRMPPFGQWSIVLAVLLLSTALPVQAAEYSNIGGHPANPTPDNPRSKSIFIHTLKLGQTVTDAVRVVNYTKEAKTLEIYATDSLISSGGAFGCSQKVEPKKAVGSWITLSTSEVTLQPNTERIVPFSITAPLNANVGGNDGCIVIQEKDGSQQRIDRPDGGALNLSFRTAIRVALLVPGDIVKRLSITDYRAVPQANGNTVLQAKIKNEGNVSIDVQLTTETHNIVNDETTRTEQEFPILRGATTDWNTEFTRPFWGGIMTSQFTAQYDANPVNTVGENDNRKIKSLTSDTIRFISWPHPLALIIELAALLSLLGLLVAIRQRIRHRRVVATHWGAYSVKEGDNINNLARQYGVSWKLLAKTNKLKPPYTLHKGDKIKVPPVKR